MQHNPEDGSRKAVDGSDGEKDDSNDLFSALFEVIPDMAFLCDSERTIVAFRSGSRDLLYAPPDRIVGRKMEDVVPVERSQTVVKNFAHARECGGLVTYQYQTRLKGEELVFEARLRHLSARGQYLVIVRNVTEQERARRNLAGSEAAFRTLLGNTPFPVVITSLKDGRLIFANRPAEALFLTDTKRFQNIDLVSYYEDPADRQRFLRDLTAAGSVMGREVRVRDREGAPLWVLASAVVMDLNEERVIIGSLSDITLQKEAELALVKEREELRHRNRELKELYRILTAASRVEAGIDTVMSELVSLTDEFLIRMPGQEVVIGYGDREWRTTSRKPPGQPKQLLGLRRRLTNGTLLNVLLYENAAVRSADGQGRPVGADLRRLLETLADKAAGFIDRKLSLERLTAQERRQHLHAERLRRQSHIIAKIGKSRPFREGNLHKLARLAVEQVSIELELDRVRLWMQPDSGTVLESIACYERKLSRHAKSEPLRMELVREEIERLERYGYLASGENAAAVHSAPFCQSCLDRDGAAAVLVCRVQSGEKASGLLSLEMLETARAWEPDEISFCLQVADQISMTYLNHRRLAAVEQLERYRQSLEYQVEERIRELDLAKKEAEAAARAKSNFLAAVGHELKTPLHAVLGYSNLLAREGLSTKQQAYAKKLDCSARNLDKQIARLLDAAMLDSGMLELNSRDFDPARLIEKCTASHARAAALKELDFQVEVDWVKAVETATASLIAGEEPSQSLRASAAAADARLPSGLPEVRGDEGRLLQAFSNIVGNAVKFTDEGSVRVNFRFVQESDSAVRMQVVVVDTGIGITPDRLETLYQPFEHDEHTLTRRFGGIGIGLAVSRQIVDALGGTISIARRAGTGTKVFIEVPLALASNPSATPRQDITTAGEGRGFEEYDRTSRIHWINEGRTVLLCGLDDPVLDAAVSMVKTLGLAVERATSPVEASALLDQDAAGWLLVVTGVPKAEQTGSWYRMVEQILRLETFPKTELVILASTDVLPIHAPLVGEELLSYFVDPNDLSGLKTVLENIAGRGNGPARPAPGTSSAGSIAACDDLETSDPAFPESRRILTEKLACIPGIDVGKGLEYLSDDVFLYRDLLVRFTDRHADEFRSIFARAAAKNIESVAAAAHKIKGLAATLGADRIHAAAWELEQTCLRAGDRELIISLAKRLADDMDHFSEAVRRELSPDASQELPPASDFPYSHVEQLGQVLKQLHYHLIIQDVAAGDLAASKTGLLALLPESLGPDIIRKIDRYDYQAALQAVDAAMKAVGSAAELLAGD